MKTFTHVLNNYISLILLKAGFLSLTGLLKNGFSVWTNNSSFGKKTPALSMQICKICMLESGVFYPGFIEDLKLRLHLDQTS